MSEPITAKEVLRETIKTIGGLWMERHGSHCDWCGARLTQDDIDGFVDWCMELGKLLDPKRKTLPPAKVFCLDCAGGAISELIDGIRYSPHARPALEPQDPWSRTAGPRESNNEPKREWYP